MNESLRDKIIENEDYNLRHFPDNKEIEKSIHNTQIRILMLKNDGNIFDYCVRTFQNGNKDKKFLEELYRHNGLMSCRDYVLAHKNEFDLNDRFNSGDLKEGYSYNYMEVCSLANKFDTQGGILVFENKNEVLIKIGKNNAYENHWLNYQHTLLLYNMKIKSNEHCFQEWITKKENRIIYDAIKTNTPLKIYAFISNGDATYQFIGIFKAADVTSDKRAFILKKIF